LLAANGVGYASVEESAYAAASESARLRFERDLQQAKPKKEQAEEFLFSRYFPALFANSERSFRRFPSVDPHSPPQSAMRSVLEDLHSGSLPQVTTRGELANILQHRLADKKRDVLRKVFAKRRPPADRQRDLEDAAEVPSPLRTDDELAAVRLCVEFAKELSVEEQLIYHYRIDGFKIAEIADLVSLSKRTVDNRLEGIKEKLAAFLAAPPSKKPVGR
jgi:ECF sigma factor